MFHRVGCVGLWAVVSCVGFPAVGAESAGPSAREIARLVRELDGDRFKQRESAMRRLLAIGKPAIEPLEKALDFDELSPEGVHRAKWLLTRLSGPGHGVVWREVVNYELWGGICLKEGRFSRLGKIRDGDVITAAEGKPVHTREQLVAMFGRYSGTPHKFRVWRDGLGEVPASLAWTNKAHPNFRTWPDTAALYQRFGHHGPWDEHIQEAIRDYYDREPEAIVKARQAWELGCRDGVALQILLEALIAAGQADRALEVGLRELPSLKGFHPGGRWRLGEIPARIVHACRVLGRREQGLALLESSLAEAGKTGAFEAVTILRRCELEVRQAEGAVALANILKAHGAELKPDDWPFETLLGVVETLAADGNQQRPLDFLASLRPTPPIRKLIDFRREQRRLAENDVPLEPHRVLAWRTAPLGICRLRRSPVWVRQPSMPMPALIEVDLCMPSFLPDEHRQSPTEVKLCAYPTSPTQIHVNLRRTGRLRFGGRGRPVEGDDRLCLWGYQKKGNRIGVGYAPGRTFVTVNGRRVRLWRHDANVGGAALLFRVTGATAVVRAIRCYVPSAAPVDNAAVAAAMAARRDAMIAGDLPAVRARQAELKSLLAPVPAAARYLDAHEHLVDLYARLFTPNGLVFSSKEVLRRRPAIRAIRSVIKRGTRKAVLDRSWGRRCLPLPMPADVEVTGILPVPAKLEKYTSWQLSWDGPILGGDEVPEASSPSLRFAVRDPNCWLSDCAGASACGRVPGAGPGRAIAFCIRARGDRAVLFANDPHKPLLDLDGLRRHHRGVAVHFKGIPYPDGLAGGPPIVLRHLPEDKPLDAPADLPKLPD